MIRQAEKADTALLMPCLMKLWPDNGPQEAEGILGEYIGGAESAAFLAEEDGRAAGMALCALRHDYVEGCDSSPVGYLEGVFVEEGCREFASNCGLSNLQSLRFHMGAGFEEANRIICFRKTLRKDA